MSLQTKKSTPRENEFLPGVVISGPNSAQFCQYFSEILNLLDQMDQSVVTQR
jgi:hypothetical protein